MTTRLIRRHCAQFRQWRFTERATRPGKQNRHNAILLQVSVPQVLLKRLRQTLKNRVVFAIDRQKTRPTLFYRLHKEASAGDERLFVRKQDIFPRINSGKRRQKTRRPDDCRHDLINFIKRGHIARRLLPAEYLGTAALLLQQRFHLAGALFVIHHRKTGGKLQALFDHSLHVFSGHKRGHGVAVRIMTYNVESAATDRAGRAEESEMLHEMPKS